MYFTASVKSSTSDPNGITQNAHEIKEAKKKITYKFNILLVLRAIAKNYRSMISIGFMVCNFCTAFVAGAA